MANSEISLRERKSAKLKLLILSTAKTELQKSNFQDLHVTNLCEKVGISKVTFFRYFPQKEDLLLYFLRVWSFEISMELLSNETKGIKAVKYIFDRYGDLCENYSSVILHLIKYHAVSPTVLKPISIKKAEKYLLFPNHEGVQHMEVLAFDKLLEKYILEAIFQTEITKSSNVSDMVSMLLTTTYGSILVAKMKQIPVKGMLKKNINSVLETF
ncbi:TetR/AcrR family transcriptional regulator [Marivirga arenosa]|uniref:TetR/AcrR family transcriptional regulator n=1 Tax=Marivirga arenosa TaxID=3059076 RepID=A0AA49JCH0_9BACT|nr:TetR/AcrR family transcriptional regulator [Marivirga sp. BKB1-2]WKK80267.2 TetR/AcrR family transcriptional regulator [Marivirga sp. BKB1-2]